MSRIGSTDILAAIAVSIGADLDGLRAGVAEARRISGDAERTIGIKVPLMLADNGARFGAEISRVIRSAQAFAAANPVRIPVVMEGGGGQRALPGGANFLGGGGGSTVLIGFPNQGAGGSFESPNVRAARPGEITIGGGLRALPGPGVSTINRATPTPSGGDDDITMNVPRGGGFGPTGGGNGAGGNGDIGGPPFVIGGGGAGGGGAGGGRLAGTRNFLNNSRWGRVIAFMALRTAIKTVNAAGDYAAMRVVGDPEMQEQYAQQYEAGLNAASLGLRPLFRQTIPNMLGIETSAQRDQEEGNRIRRAAERQDLQAARVFAAGQENRQITRAGQFAHLTIGMSDTQVGVAQAQRALSEFDERRGIEGGDTSRMSAGTKQARSILQQGIVDALKQDAEWAANELRQGRREATDIIGSAQSSAIGVTGGEVAGGRASLRRQVGSNVQAAMDEVTVLRGQGVGMTDPRMIRAMMRVGAVAVGGAIDTAAFNFGAARESGQLISASQSRMNQADLMARGDTKGADIEQIRRTFKQQIDQAELTFGPNSNAVMQLQRERDDAIGRRQQQGNGGIFGPPNRQREMEGFAISTATRRAVATAISNNEPLTAGVAARIGGMREELSAASRVAKENPNDSMFSQQLRDLIAVQKMEAGAMQRQFLRPNQYATEFDPRREVTGGPGGQTGKDQRDLLKLIADYLKEIKDNNGGIGA